MVGHKADARQSTCCYQDPAGDEIRARCCSVVSAQELRLDYPSGCEVTFCDYVRDNVRY